MNHSEVLVKHKSEWKYEEVTFEEYYKAVDSIINQVKFTPTPEQLDFLLSADNKSILLDATAGSGKTTSIIVNSLIDQKLWGLDEDSDILFLTFSKKAAIDMLEKRTNILARNFNGERNLARMSTIHSLCFTLLKMFAKNYGLLHFFDESFIIQDELYSISDLDQKSLTTESYDFSEIDDFDMDDFDIDMLESQEDEFSKGNGVTVIDLIKKFINQSKDYEYLDNYMEMRNVTSIISYQKETMLSDEEIVTTRIFQDTKCMPEHYFQLRDKFEKEKEIFGYLDFTDMQIFTLRLLREFKDKLMVNDSFNKLFNPKVIYVDEYQDLTRLQKELIKELVYFEKEPKKLICIGDSDQSIYEWRGASSMEFSDFQELYGDNTKLLTFTINHRCGSSILNVANKLINLNVHRNPKVMLPLERVGNFEIKTYTNTKNLVHHLIQDIKHIRDTHGEEELENVAVIYREHSQALGLTTALLRNDILFNLGGSRKLPYNHWIFRNILLICQTILNAEDMSYFSNLYRFTPLNSRMMNDFKEEFVQCRKKNIEFTWIDLLEKRNEMGKSPYTDKKYISTYRKLREALLTDEPVRPVIEQVYSLYQQHNLNYVLDKLIFVHRTEIEAIELFISSIPNTEIYDTLYKNISNWESQISRSKRMDYGIKLMSMHATKGLEFKRIFIIGLDNNYLPKDTYAKELSPLNEEKYIEEERRLLYVGITRAIESCTVYASLTEPSRFLPNLDSMYEEYLSKNVPQVNNKEKPVKEDKLKYIPDNIKEGLSWTLEKYVKSY